MDLTGELNICMVLDVRNGGFTSLNGWAARDSKTTDDLAETRDRRRMRLT